MRRVPLGPKVLVPALVLGMVRNQLLRARRLRPLPDPPEPPPFPMRRRTKRRLKIVALISFLLYSLPIQSCPRDRFCREDHDALMRAATNPWATPAQTAAILDWAEKSRCRVCGGRGQVSLMMWRWSEITTELGHFWETGPLHF